MAPVVCRHGYVPLSHSGPRRYKNWTNKNDRRWARQNLTVVAFSSLLTHYRLVPHKKNKKKNNVKQCRLRSDAASDLGLSDNISNRVNF